MHLFWFWCFHVDLIQNQQRLSSYLHSCYPNPLVLVTKSSWWVFGFWSNLLCPYLFQFFLCPVRSTFSAFCLGNIDRKSWICHNYWFWLANQNYFCYQNHPSFLLFSCLLCWRKTISRWLSLQNWIQNMTWRLRWRASWLLGEHHLHLPVLQTKNTQLDCGQLVYHARWIPHGTENVPSYTWKLCWYRFCSSQGRSTTPTTQVGSNYLEAISYDIICTLLVFRTCSHWVAHVASFQKMWR